MGEETYGRPLKAVGGHCVAASARRQTDEQTDRQRDGHCHHVKSPCDGGLIINTFLPIMEHDTTTMLQTIRGPILKSSIDLS